MSGGPKPQGYTIIELMIFLVVSSALLVSALLLVGGQQQKTEFAQSIREIDSKIRDIINDVASGVYTNPANFKCVADDVGGTPAIQDSASDTQGTNLGCTYVGRVIQFAPNGDYEAFNVFSIAGRQFTRSVLASKQVQSLPQAKPVPIAPGRIVNSALTANATESNKLGYGLKLKDNTTPPFGLSYDKGSGPQPIGAFGFFSNFVNYSSASTSAASFESSKQYTDMWVVPASTLGDDPLDLADKIVTIGGLAAAAIPEYKAPQKGITLCFLSGGTDQYGKIVIGDDQNRLTTHLTIGNGSDCL